GLRDLAAGAVARRAGALSVRWERRADGRVGERPQCGGAVPVAGCAGGGWGDAGCCKARGVSPHPLSPSPIWERGDDGRGERGGWRVTCRALCWSVIRALKRRLGDRVPGGEGPAG